MSHKDILRQNQSNHRGLSPQLAALRCTKVHYPLPLSSQPATGTKRNDKLTSRARRPICSRRWRRPPPRFPSSTLGRVVDQLVRRWSTAVSQDNSGTVGEGGITTRPGAERGAQLHSQNTPPNFQLKLLLHRQPLRLSLLLRPLLTQREVGRCCKLPVEAAASLAPALSAAGLPATYYHSSKTTWSRTCGLTAQCRELSARRLYPPINCTFCARGPLCA